MRSPLIFRIFRDNQLVGVKQFDQDQIVIGHNAEVHLDLDAEEISPIHCLIELRDNGYYICDLGSQQGTFKNGQAILDELLSSGDEIQLGPFKINFFVGVPKPQVKPGAAPTVAPPAPAAIPPAKPVEASPMPPAAVVKKEEVTVEPLTIIEPVPAKEPPLAVASIPDVVPPIEVKPPVAPVPVKPEIRKGPKSFKKDRKTKTFAPSSEVQDLKTYLKPGKGPMVEVLVAWKERILTTYHFRGTKPVRVNAGQDRQIALPEGLIPKGYPLLEMSGGLKVNTTAGMHVDIVSVSGKITPQTAGQPIRLDQNEMVCLTLPGNNITLYIRYVPQAPLVPMLPSLMLSSSELTGVAMAMIIVGLLALYISATTPKEWEENKQEEVQRIAQVIFKNPPPAPKPVEPPPVAQVPPTPPPAPSPKPTPAVKPTPQKVNVADSTKEAQKKGPVVKKPVPAQTAGRASEVAPKPNAKDRTKKFTSTRQGGAVKTGETAGANAKSANKDLSKVGLFSAFGGGGNRANIDKAYSGAGEVLGMADRATGTSGFAENRAGNDLGSRFKDSGAGGKGTATQGIAGVGTRGRGSGQSAYGAADGLGSKSSVQIDVGGGFEESFDGTIDKEAIRRVIRSKLNEVKSCYERALNTLEKGRRLEGKVILGWDIIERGQARNVKVKSSSLGNPEVEECIRRRLASWTFPEPPPGLTAVVQAYPFVLNQSN